MIVTIYFDDKTGCVPAGIMLQTEEAVEKFDHEDVTRLKRLIETYERLRDEHGRPAQHGDGAD